MADISAELAIIDTATKGEQVKSAIYDALRKINIDAETPIVIEVPYAYSAFETFAVSDSGYVSDDIIAVAEEVS